jgi:GNAT acetyltransferase
MPRKVAPGNLRRKRLAARLDAGVRLLAIQAATLFALTESGRLRHANSPNRAAAPRMWIGGSAAGNVVRLRVDVGSETADAIEALVAREPPMSDADDVPAHVDDYAELLDAEAPVEKISRGLTYVFPEARAYRHGSRVVSSDTPAGAQLLARLEVRGMPEELVEMGFADAADLWPPWCAALSGATVASVAFTARLSPLGAEVGVATSPRFRGRGLAAAATAAWASLPALQGRTLFYSADATNVSSQRVAGRLELEFVGPSLSIC